MHLVLRRGQKVSESVCVYIVREESNVLNRKLEAQRILMHYLHYTVQKLDEDRDLLLATPL